MKKISRIAPRQLPVFLRILLVAVFAVISLAVLQPKAEAVIPCKHLSSTWRVTRAATCTQTGLRQKVCTKCGAVVQTQTLPKVAHQSKGYYETVSNSTCTTDGKKVLKCRYCNVVMDSQVITRLGHNLSWITTIEATCTQRGEQKQTCSRCSYSATRAIPMKDHVADPAGYIVVKEPTCAVEGNSVLKCRDCHTVLDEMPVTPLGHECYVERQNATCTQDGWELLKCARCGCTVSSVVRPALGHALSWVTTTEPTCNQRGEQQQKCSRCSYIAATRTLPMKDHMPDPAGYVVVQAATCTASGKRVLRCRDCQTIIDEMIIPPLGHNYNNTGLCTVCTRCGQFNDERHQKTLDLVGEMIGDDKYSGAIDCYDHFGATAEMDDDGNLISLSFADDTLSLIDSSDGFAPFGSNTVIAGTTSTMLQGSGNFTTRVIITPSTGEDIYGNTVYNWDIASVQVSALLSNNSLTVSFSVAKQMRICYHPCTLDNTGCRVLPDNYVEFLESDQIFKPEFEVGYRSSSSGYIGEMYESWQENTSVNDQNGTTSKIVYNRVEQNASVKNGTLPGERVN